MNLCPKRLKGLDGELCGREIDKRGHGLCAWHTDLKLGIIPRDEYPGACSKHTCCDCGERAVSFRVTMRCRSCHRRFIANREITQRDGKPVRKRQGEP